LRSTTLAALLLFCSGNAAGAAAFTFGGEHPLPLSEVIRGFP